MTNTRIQKSRPERATFSSSLIALFLMVLLLESGMSFFGQASAPVRIMPLGDSITKGVSGPSTDDAGYRNDLDSLLTDEGLDFDFVGVFSDGTGFDADHAGHDGFRADRLLTVVRDVLAASPPHLVLLHIGSNDVSGVQEPEGIRDEIAAIVDEIHTYDSNIKILLASLIPRIDEKDEKNSVLNELLVQLYLAKRNAGAAISYVGMNEILKDNPDWPTAYFSTEDPVHPNDFGFQVMAQVWSNAIMTAVNQNGDFAVSDNFERSRLGITWNADPELTIENGDLVNTASSGSSRWEYMAAYKAVKNPTRVAVRWSENAKQNGISRGGLALMLDQATAKANGFLAWITTEDNLLRLWTIEEGQAGEDLNLERVSLAPEPGPGDLFRVDLRASVDSLWFDYFVADEFAGSIAVANPRLNQWYSGILLRHRRQNQVADFLAEGSGDFEPPAQVLDLSVDSYSATSAILSWTAPGDDGDVGRAARYDLRFATEELSDENRFNEAESVIGLPAPARAGGHESFAELDLQPATTYYFAMRVWDDVGNRSPISNVAAVTTDAGFLSGDDFNRSLLGDDWNADASLAIIDGELVNTSEDQASWNLAVFLAQPNPVEVSFRWSPSADTVGIDQGGIAVFLDAPDTTASGYLITRRTLRNEIRLWRIVNGQDPESPVVAQPLLVKPKPGDEFRIRLSSDGDGNHFTVYINGRQGATVTDPDFFIDPRAQPEFYSGVMLAGGRNNRIDKFKALRGDVPVSVDPSTPEIPSEFSLSQNYPNPFNPQTHLDYQLQHPTEIDISIFNLTGQLVRVLFRGQRPAGRYTAIWDGRTDAGLLAGSGTYIVRMQAGDRVFSRRMILLR